MRESFRGNRGEQEAFLRLLEQAVEKAQEDIDEDRINPEEFRGLYSDRIINEHLEYVARMKQIFESESNPDLKRAKQMGEVLEVIFNEQVELSNWLSETTTTRKASEYDDIKNGIDTIATTTITSTDDEENKAEVKTHFALAFDMTHASHSGLIDKKITRIKREIENGTLSTINYFIDEEERFKGQQLKVPRVIIGADKKTLEGLIGLWLDGNKKELAVHPVQLQIIDEIVIQLQTYRDYAEELGRDDIARIYSRQLQIMKQIMKTKQPLYDKLLKSNKSYHTTDAVYMNIDETLRNFDEL